MSYDIAVSVKNISKVYPIYNKPIDRLKEVFWRGNKKFHNEFVALDNISFDVPKGKTMGIIGKNGSGKSTLLQIIAGTLAPTTGSVKLNGRIAAILELGAGFNPEFTGRENAFLNGAILGLSKEEMEERFDEIAAFADIGEFIDQPVKTYSSGMFVRLAFSVAVHVNPDILIVDEALAVGDIFFTHKCKNKMREIVDSGKTVLFVSHDILTIKSFCDEAILLEKGKISMRGSGEEVADTYQKLLHEENYQNPKSKKSEKTSEQNIVNKTEIESSWFVDEELVKNSGVRFGDGTARFVGVRLENIYGEPTSLFKTGDQVHVKANVLFYEDCETPLEYGVLVRDINGIDIFGFNSHVLKIDVPPQKKGTKMSLKFSFAANLAPGSYSLVFGLKEKFPSTHYLDKVFSAAVFEIAPLPTGEWIPGIVKVPGKSSFEVIDVTHGKGKVLSANL